MKKGDFVRPLHDENIVGRVYRILQPDDELPSDLQQQDGPNKQITYRDRDLNVGFPISVRARVEWESIFGTPYTSTIPIDRLVSLEPVGAEG